MLIMKSFYDLLLADDSNIFFFIKVTFTQQHLPIHFETLAAFWELVLFITGGYYANIFQIYKEIYQKICF